MAICGHHQQQQQQLDDQVQLTRCKQRYCASSSNSNDNKIQQRQQLTTTFSDIKSKLKFNQNTKPRHCRQRNLRSRSGWRAPGEYLLVASFLIVFITWHALNGSAQQQQQQQQQARQVGRTLPDLTSATSDEPILAVVGQDAFISCVAKNLQNYTIVWRFTNDADAPGELEQAQAAATATTTTDNANKVIANTDLNNIGNILTAGRQRVIADERFSVIQSHDTWLLKISNVRLSDTGTYICSTNSEPSVRVPRVLSVIKQQQQQQSSDGPVSDALQQERFDAIDYNFTDCCRNEYVVPRCQRLCSFQQLASRYQSINIVHECYSALPSITRCMVAGRNVTDCCQRRHIPTRCNPMCGHLGDTSAMSVQDQSYCADYSASIMSCVADGISTLPGQPELVVVEAVSSSTLKVSWTKVVDKSELAKLDGWIINLTKLSSFADTISASSSAVNNNNDASKKLLPAVAITTLDQQSQKNASFNNTILSVVDAFNKTQSLAAVTKLLLANTNTSDAEHLKSPPSVSFRLANPQLDEFAIEHLKPYTVYEIQMFAYNSHGRSQLTDPIRALTLAPENEQVTSDGDAYVEPTLPDTRKCCLERGVTLKRCLDTLCDPVEADRATIADLMICAPWSNVTFGCLSSRQNHTDCCKARGVSPFCLSMCANEIKRVDYRHFRCLTHMSTYTNCILESHNVLPSEPLNFTVGPITSTWAVLNWRPPQKHARSLQGYRILWRRVESSGDNNNNNSSSLTQLVSASTYGDNDADFYYSKAEAATNPYLLDALTPATLYETFVVAVNKFGMSEPSARYIFRTPPAAAGELTASSNGDGQQLESRLPLQGGGNSNNNNNNNFAERTFYNETACCVSSGVHSSCQQLCDYDLKVNDVASLITSCNSQMPVVLRCMAGSRNSVPCCRNRRVADQCLNVCAGLTEHSPLVVATRCASDFGKIIRCMDEGSKQIPGAPLDLHTIDIESERVSIKWRPANEDVLRTDVEYHVRYQRLQQTTQEREQQDTYDPSTLIAVVPLHPLEHNLILTTNKTQATIDKLRPQQRYSIYVTAENSYGISLPSLVLVIQTPPAYDNNSNNDQQTMNNDAYKRRATLGAPHSLEILRSDTDSIALKWIAPLFIVSDAQIKYRVFYKRLSTQFASGNTTTTTTSSNDQQQQQQSDGSVQQLASNWTVLETLETHALLRQLHYSSQYAITVQAFTNSTLGHMSEILLANTARPVPPTLNHPLVINSPIEGRNITIMCVALGQPTPQISMFINGLLVQKRTQPYVIYHLVNLVRGHLTITCFASNGHGKDYASVQSRTEVSVKFASQARARINKTIAMVGSTARMTCEVSGNPQPTVVWTKQQRRNNIVQNTGNGDDSSNSNKSLNVVVQANERITTLLVSQFETPFTWTHTLTIRNVSKQLDEGQYACRARNVLADSADTIDLAVSDQERLSGGDTTLNHLSLKQLEQRSDLMDCCRSQNVSAKCLPVCSLDGLDVESAFKTAECQPHLDKLMFCAADGSDHRSCCRARQVPSSCLRWCSGARLTSPALCFLSSALDINQCFESGRNLLPGPPRNVRVVLASQSEHCNTGCGGADEEQQGQLGNTEVVVATTTSTFGVATPTQSATSDTQDSSPPTPVIPTTTITPANDNTLVTTSNIVATTEQQRNSNSEPLIVEWDAPIKNAHLVQYYRIFWRPIGSRELSRTVTNLTWLKLNDLNMDRQYEFVVKAANQHGSSVYSEPLEIKPADILTRGDLSTVGMIWFMPSPGVAHLFGRLMWAICFAILFMGSSLAIVMLLEQRGYLKRFASSKSNSSRVSFANPTYSKDTDTSNSALGDGDTITWGSGSHSLDVLGLPPSSQQEASSESTNNESQTTTTGSSQAIFSSTNNIDDLLK